MDTPRCGWLKRPGRLAGRSSRLSFRPTKQQYAREQLTKAGLEKFVDFRPGDAKESLANLNGPVDFVLLDLWKDLYVPCFDLFYPKLSPGALVVADNMTYPKARRLTPRSIENTCAPLPISNRCCCP